MGCGGIASSISDTIGDALLPSTPGADFEGIYSVVTSDGWTVDVSPPTVPTGLTVSAATAIDTETPLLSWTASAEAGSGVSIYKVQLYQAENTPVGSEVILASGQKITSLSLTAGVNYKFAVSAE